MREIAYHDKRLFNELKSIYKLISNLRKLREHLIENYHDENYAAVEAYTDFSLKRILAIQEQIRSMKTVKIDTSETKT